MYRNRSYDLRIARTSLTPWRRITARITWNGSRRRSTEAGGGSAVGLWNSVVGQYASRLPSTRWKAEGLVGMVSEV